MPHAFSLFAGDPATRSALRRPKPSGGSANPIVFRDYESFVAKFADNPKTTDDCYTPQDIYEAVVRYVGEICNLSGKQILRPFYPGGDYENAEYPDNGVVIDNPPFSIFTKIVKFYTTYGVPFFLFGPGLTISSCCKYCTAVIVSESVRFSNGAEVKCNFATNLMGDTLMATSVRLSALLKNCKSQNQKVNLPKYGYPAEVLSVSDFQSICRGSEDFAVSRSEGLVIRTLDLHPKKGGLFGDHLLVSQAAAAKAAAANIIPIPLSEREQREVQRLGERRNADAD